MIEFFYLFFYFIFPIILAAYFTYRSKRRLLIASWFALGFLWAFFSFFARAAYVEQPFIETRLWVILTFPMYSVQWFLQVFIVRFLELIGLISTVPGHPGTFSEKYYQISENMGFPLTLILSLLYLSPFYILIFFRTKKFDR